ncbi:MAG: GntR family transcriptional regulator [Actinobacteria bacterium]|nr:GntR family transcriptional regulator [Actinomycetota bacterium]
MAATNVRRIAANLGVSKDTAARALARLVDAGLVVRHRRRGASGEFVHSRYEVRLDPGDGITVVVPAPGPTSPCPVVGDSGRDRPWAPPSPAWSRSPVRAGHRRHGAPVTSPVPVAVSAGLDHPGAHLSDHVSPSPAAAHDPRNHALTVHHPELAYPPPTDTDDLTTTAPSALHHVHDRLTTTATTAHTTATNHDHNRSRHWHPAVPATKATLPATGEGAGVAPC